MPTAKRQKKPPRRETIIEAASALFARNGYDGTSMRDIAAESGILAGSLYYYFASKEEMFAAVHEQAINRLCTGTLKAINPAADPWTRLQQASEGYLTTMLSSAMQSSLIITEFPLRRSGKLRAKLVTDRRRFEAIFSEIVDALPLAPDVDRSYWRLALLGMLAWTHVWYDNKGDSPNQVAQQLVDLLKERTATP